MFPWKKWVLMIYDTNLMQTIKLSLNCFHNTNGWFLYRAAGYLCPQIFADGLCVTLSKDHTRNTRPTRAKMIQVQDPQNYTLRYIPQNSENKPRGLHSEGLMYGGKFACQNRLGWPYSWKEIYRFSLFYLVFEGNFQVQVLGGWGGGGGLIFGGAFQRRVFCVTVLSGLCLEGLIFGILRYL